MARTEPFDKYLDEYEQWFEEHHFVYESELEAVGQFIPKSGKGIEIGIGTGRFALPFGIKEGVEASCVMRHFAMHKGLEVYDGIAEELPLPGETYDFVLMVTTICFVDNIKKAFGEVRRVLKPGGKFIIGLVDKNSPLGKTYEEIKDQNKFYRYATFYSTDEVKKLLVESRFRNIDVIQTVFGELADIHNLQLFEKGYGTGGFVVINATKAVEK
ncbi:MAG: class I SAM-dependent methyltransferase [Ignavibacteriaceae bacterium]